MRKKGAVERSTTSSMATIVLLILIFFIAYLILLPEEAREDVLEGREISFGDGGDVVEEEKEDVKTLFIESPGRIYPYSEEKEVKDISSVSLFSTLAKGTKKLAQSLEISRSLFINNDQELVFKIEDLRGLRDLGLFFNVVESRGNLKLSLNGQQFYYGKASSVDIPINLPLGNLRAVNKIRFEASTPGLRFLSKNYFRLLDVQLIEGTQREHKKESRSFVVDKDRVSDARLEFFVNCMKLEQGVLRVLLNERNLFTGRIVCDASKSKIDIPIDYLADGDNNLLFEIDKGDYILEGIRLHLDVESQRSPIYYFNVDEDDLGEIELRMDFSDDEHKRATLLINGERLQMDTFSEKFIEDISDEIREGENYIKIIPNNQFDIVNLEVVLVE